MPSIITNSTIAKARADSVPGCVPYDITDARAQGLELRVRPRGAMWCIRYKIAGASKRLTAGSIDLLSIAEARQIATDAQAVLRASTRISAASARIASSSGLPWGAPKQRFTVR